MKNFITRYVGFFLLMLITQQVASQQGMGETTKSLKRARISPTHVSLSAGDKQQFHVVMVTTRLTSAYNPENVVWSVNGIIGGNAKVGTISNSGLYTAPGIATGLSEIYVTGYTKGADNAVNTATVVFNGVKISYKTVLDFGEAKENSKHFKNPTAIAVDRNGNFLITDKVVLRFSPAGKFISSFGQTEGDIIGHFDGLTNITTDRSNKIFISDQKITPPRLMAFSQEGKHLYSFGVKGAGPGMSFVTRGIAFDSKNRMYLGDVDLNRVTVFDNSGKYQFHFGKAGAGTGHFNGYYDLALDMNNDVFVANYFGPCQKYDAAGNYLFSFAQPNPPDGIIYTTDIATDSKGNVFVAVRGAERENGEFELAKDESGATVHIIKYNNNGDFLTGIALADAGKKPVRITTDKKDRLVVLYKTDKKIGVEVLAEQ